MLSRVQWDILNAVVNDMEPVEQIALGLKRKGHALSADELLRQILLLFQSSFVVISQEPIPAFGQTFPARLILPESPRDVLGDLAQRFEEFYALGDYVRKEKACARSEASGVPFGIYLTLTETGRRGRDDLGYEYLEKQK